MCKCVYALKSFPPMCLFFIYSFTLDFEKDIHNNKKQQRKQI